MAFRANLSHQHYGGGSMAKSSLFDSIKTAVSLIPASERWQLLRISILQIFLSFLDLAGVIFIGALGSLAVRGVASQGAGDRVSQILSFLRLDEFSFQGQITSLGILAAMLLTSRSIFSFLISRKTIFIMAKKSAKLSSEIIRSLSLCHNWRKCHNGWTSSEYSQYGN